MAISPICNIYTWVSFCLISFFNFNPSRCFCCCLTNRFIIPPQMDVFLHWCQLRLVILKVCRHSNCVSVNNGNKFCSSKSFTSILILLSPDWNELVSIPSEIGNLASLQELDLGELVSMILYFHCIWGKIFVSLNNTTFISDISLCCSLFF